MRPVTRNDIVTALSQQRQIPREEAEQLLAVVWPQVDKTEFLTIEDGYIDGE